MDTAYLDPAALRREVARRQRRLIPVNLVVMVLCVVAVLSLLFLPLFSADLAAVYAAVPASSEEGGAEEGAEASVGDFLAEIEVDISVTGLGLIEVGFVEKPLDALAELLGGTLAEASDSLAANMIAAAGAAAAEAGLDGVDTDALLDDLRALEEAQGSEQADEAIAALVADLRTQLGADVVTDEVAADLQQMIRDQYDETVSHTGGRFDSEAFVCVALSSMVNGSEEGTGEVYTSYAELLRSFFGELPGGEGAQDTFHTVMLAVSAALLVFIGVWAVLFLFAFFRLFAKNKRFLMWYVKIFGVFPCLLFGVLPLVGKAVAGGEIAAVLGAVSTLTWISGGCWVLLWLVSIFWAFPIKRKIRALNRQLKAFG